MMPGASEVVSGSGGGAGEAVGVGVLGVGLLTGAGVGPFYKLLVFVIRIFETSRS